MKRWKTWTFCLTFLLSRKRGDNSLKMPDTVMCPCHWHMFMTLNVCLKFQVNTFDSYRDMENLNILLNIFAKSERGDNSYKMHDTVMCLCHWPMFMSLNICLKFQVNTFDSYRDIKNLNILLNIFAKSEKGGVIHLKCLTQLCVLVNGLCWWPWMHV